MARTNILPIVLPKPLYDELERQADAEDRDPLQQARWILRRALEETKTASGHQPLSAVPA